MRDFNEQNITAAVIDRFATTPDPRLRRIMTSLTQHLHDFIRDVDLTVEEWSSAIDFLTRTGKMCTDKRQEFILLSDTLGASMLVDAINHRLPEGATETTVLGPFFVQDAPDVPNGADISGGMQGMKLFIDATVTSVEGQPISGAEIEVWHSDAEGFYDVQRPDLEGSAMRARLRSGPDGRFSFWTIQPAGYPIPTDGPVGEMLRATNRHPFRPAHVHFMLSAPGFEKLVTHIFVAGDEHMDTDAVFAVKNSLIREFVHEPPGVAPDGRRMDQPWSKLVYRFALKRAGDSEKRVSENKAAQLV